MFLLIGGNSEIGAATARFLRGQGQPVITTTRRPGALAEDETFLDLAQLPVDWRPPEGVAAACIFVAVARLAACEADWAGSNNVNVTQTLKLAEKLVARGIYTLFLSTNQVFDGTGAKMPADAPFSPVSAYGRQKAATDAAFKGWVAAGAPAGILRLAKVVSPDMALLHGWRRKLAVGEPIRAFRDMKMAPTPTALVAEAIGRILAKAEPVIAQLTGPEDVSYDEVAAFIAQSIGADRRLITSVSAHEDGVAAGSTPPHTTLDSAYLADRHGIVAPEPWAVVRAILEAGRAAGAARSKVLDQP
jgi:dTDP-4-dehydrorhamnose reductase